MRLLFLCAEHSCSHKLKAEEVGGGQLTELRQLSLRDIADSWIPSRGLSVLQNDNGMPRWRQLNHARKHGHTVA